MKLVIAGVLALMACAGPSRQQLSDTPTAQTKRTPSHAPPASTDDRDRAQVEDSWDSREDAQNAHREAGHEAEQPPPPPPTSR
jgi:hypothetical protein